MSRLIIAVGELADGSVVSIYAGRDASAVPDAIAAATRAHASLTRALVIRNPLVAKRVPIEPKPEGAIPLSRPPAPAAPADRVPPPAAVAKAPPSQRAPAHRRR